MQLLQQLAGSICDAGVFLVLTSRSVPEGKLNEITEKLKLEALSRDSVKVVLKTIAGSSRSSAVEEFTDFLMKSTSGIPLLVIELILHSLETESLGRDSDGQWFIANIPDNIIPGSAESFVQARINRLGNRERLAVQVASVLGNEFLLTVFCELFRRMGGDSAAIVLGRLLNLGLICSNNNDTFSFTNSVIPGTSYRTMTKESRKLIHRNAAEVLKNQKTATVMAMARHWIEAEAGAESLPFLFKALEKCIDLGDIVRAEVLSKELHLRIPGNAENEESFELEFLDMKININRGRFQTALGSAEWLSNKLKGTKLAYAEFVKGQCKENLGVPLPEVAESYLSAANTAEAAGDMNTKALALCSAGGVFMSIGKPGKAIQSFNTALENHDLLNSSSLARIHGNMGLLMQRTGNNHEALEHLKKTLELGRQCGNMGIQANALSFMGVVRINMGMSEEGINNIQDALKIHRKAGNRSGECATMGSLGGQLSRVGEMSAAIHMLEQAITLAEQINHTRGIMTFNSNLALALTQKGDYHRAEHHIRKSLEMMKDSGDKQITAVGHLNLSTILMKLSRLTEAMEEARRALRFACAANALSTQVRALSLLGWLMIETDRPAMGQNFFLEAEKRCSHSGDHLLLSDLKAGEGVARTALGDMEKARECYLSALELKDKYGTDGKSEETLERLAKALNEQNI
ncbi:hypothetical protein CSA37_09655 [Candidatus Fermentibacteria bacterium]|nr:MAG: hypothetical protein CSA37_09655 [Candidatus Fermentibacteria bacterium]